MWFLIYTWEGAKRQGRILKGFLMFHTSVMAMGTRKTTKNGGRVFVLSAKEAIFA